MKRLFLVFPLLFLLGNATPLPAVIGRGGDFLTLYDQATLRHWQERYPANVRFNFQRVLLGHLTAAERRRLGAVTLEFPLVGEFQATPLDFYVPKGRAAIVLPILSIKFLDDLAIASSWLQAAGYTQESPLLYMGLLKYRRPADFPDHRLPPPRSALHIPANALDLAGVDDMAQKYLKSAILFVLAHELGHLYHDHPGYEIDPRQAQANEAEADRFAMECLRRIGVVPFGIVFYFTAAVSLAPNRGDFDSDLAWERYQATRATHPFSAARLRALATFLRRHQEDFASTQPDLAQGRQMIANLATQVETLGTVLSDPEMQHLIATKGRTATVASLTPRAAVGRLASTAPPANHGHGEQTTAAPPFTGVYQGVFTSRGQAAQVPISVELYRSGSRVTGSYDYGVGQGTLVGTIVDGDLYLDWREGRSFGRAVFHPKGDGFTGTWGYGESRDNGGTWSGQR